MKYIHSLKELPKEQWAFAGGKAKSLAYMMQNTKLRIPSGYVILSNAIADGKLKEPAQQELTHLMKSLDTSTPYAVRSSALNEDGEQASFAGQYETVTDVPRDGIPAAVE